MAGRRGRTIAALAATMIAGAAPAGQQPVTAPPELRYTLTEGQNVNVFVRDGQTAAHLLLRNGTDPRILVAFPAGNSGTGVWFEPLARPATWQVLGRVIPIANGEQRGISAAVLTDAPRLAIRQAVLSNVRYLRDYQSVGRFPAEVAARPIIGDDMITWRRPRLDGAPGYELSLKVLRGRIVGGIIVADTSGHILVQLSATTGETPLTGIPLAELLNARAADDPTARNALRFLSYREKFLAGSWRFDTYFGRDTLMSVRLLMPALRGPAVEAGLGSVLARLAPNGEVAHEEGIGEFAVMENRRAGKRGDAPSLDYGMIDDDYMLGPVAAEYLLNHADASAARAFLARPIPSVARPGSSELAGVALVRNLRFVLAQALPFAERPDWRRLIALKDNRLTGQWRDSEEGLGRGKYAYDVNAALVPAALEAAQRLAAAGLLAPYLDRDAAAFRAAARTAAIWRKQTPPLFRVDTPAAQAAPAIHAYAASVGVPASPALAALGSAPLSYHAIALDARGRPVPIVNSDEGFALLFGHPDPADLATFVGALARPFPAGLMTDIGLLVANPALADAQVQARFTPAAYHGAVVWSWQQALFAAGLERQLARTDLPPATRAVLRDAQAKLWRAIQATRVTQSSELWSWAYAGGRYRVVAFGAGKQDVDESNAAQLWSTVYLAVRPPSGSR